MEFWTQNSIESPADRVALMKTVLKEESLTTFDAAIADKKKDAEEISMVLFQKAVNNALTKVAKTVSLRALESQKACMRKYIRILRT